MSVDDKLDIRMGSEIFDKIKNFMKDSPDTPIVIYYAGRVDGDNAIVEQVYMPKQCYDGHSVQIGDESHYYTLDRILCSGKKYICKVEVPPFEL